MWVCREKIRIIPETLECLIQINKIIPFNKSFYFMSYSQQIENPLYDGQLSCEYNTW